MSDNPTTTTESASSSSTGMLVAFLGFLGMLWAAYLAFVRIPHVTTVFQDFGTDLPSLTILVVRFPWLPLLLTIPAVVMGIIAAINRSRALSIVAIIILVLSMVCVLGAQAAIELPLLRLIQSV